MKPCGCGCGVAVQNHVRFVRGHRTTEHRFWSKVKKTDLCWLWTAGRFPSSCGYYGCFRADGRNIRAHRYAYELLVGPIPEGLQLDHLCRNTLCVNPDHLEPVTARENNMRGFGVGAEHARKTHCHRGHPFSDENTRINPKDGRRICATCHRERNARHVARKALQDAPVLHPDEIGVRS